MLYKFCKFLFPKVFSLLFKTEVRGIENIPRAGRVIVAANHLSNWDPPVLASYVPRNVSYMAKEELFKPELVGNILRRLGAFPVKRGAADRGAIKTALGVLKKDLCLGLFPEGTRSRDGKLGKAEAGVALLAAMSKAPIVPVAIIGTNKIFQKGSLLPKLKIIFGEPLYFTGQHNDREALEEFSKKIMKKIENLILMDSQV